MYKKPIGFHCPPEFSRKIRDIIYDRTDLKSEEDKLDGIFEIISSSMEQAANIGYILGVADGKLEQSED